MTLYQLQILTAVALGMYLLTDLTLGANLLFIPSRRLAKPIVPLMKLAGFMFLSDGIALVAGGLTRLIFQEELYIYSVSCAIDCFTLGLSSLLGPTLIYARYPSRKTVIIQCIPFAIMGISTLIWPEYDHHVCSVASLILLCISFYWVWRVIRRHMIRQYVYSNLEGKKNIWFVLFPIFLVIQLGLYSIGNLTGWSKHFSSCIFYLSSVLIFRYLYYNIMTQQAPEATIEDEIEDIDIDEVEPDTDTDTEHSKRMDALKEKLNFLMQDKKLYKDAELNIETLAKELGLNRTYMYYLMRNELKQSFADYVNSHRVEEAKRLLKETDEKIAVIAKESGFSSPQSFNRVFKSIVGQPPSEWRSN